jgi:hypothetical protein
MDALGQRGKKWCQMVTNALLNDMVQLPNLFHTCKGGVVSENVEITVHLFTSTG